MKMKSLRIYVSVIALIIVAIYVLLFVAFAKTPYSSQAVFFFLFIPFLIAVNWASLFFTAQYRSDEGMITSIVPVLATQCLYTVLALVVAFILAAFGSSMKTQIVIQVAILLVGAIGMMVSFFSASAAKESTKVQCENLQTVKDIRSKFRKTVDEMEAKGLTGENAQLLSSLWNEYEHIAPCNTAEAAAIDKQIDETLDDLAAKKAEDCDGSLAMLRFLVKRRIGLRSK